MMAQNGNEQPLHVHQVVIDGNVVYEGDGWASVFLDASKNPENGIITYVEDGKPGAAFGVPLHKQTLLDP
jgi:hypothetical protein